MKLSPYKKASNSADIGFYPLVTTLTLLLIHYFSGALDWPAYSDVDAQRDFNSAIAMSLLTGYFWLSLRMLHQNVASCLISLLVKSHQLGQFAHHRSRLSSEFTHHIFNASIVSILITVVYCILEGLLSSTQEFHVLMLTALAVPFWFFSILYIMQVSTNLNYLTKELLPQAESTKDYVTSLTSLIRLGLSNAILSVGGLALAPIFWFKKDVPSLDVFVVCVFGSSLLVYLFLPVIKLRFRLHRERKALIKALEADIASRISKAGINNDPASLSSIEALESEREALEGLSISILTFKDKLQIVASFSLIPLSWLLLAIFEWIIATPF